MRRMYSEKQLEAIIKQEVESGQLENAKPIYWHTVKIQRGGNAQQATFARILGYIIILNNNATPIDSTSLIQLLNTSGFTAVMHSGKASNSAAANLENLTECTRIEYSADNQLKVIFRDQTTTIEDLFIVDIDSGWVLVQDLGANKIN